jgi:hypothetical protein
MKDKILQIIKSKPKHFATIIKKSPELCHWVTVSSSIQTSNFAEMIYSAVHGMTNICDNGNIKKFNSINEGYRFCGPASRCECALKSVKIRVSQAKQNYTEQQRQQILQQRQQTTLERYGVVNNGQTKNARLRHQEYYHNITRKPKPTKTSSYQRLNKKYQSMADVVFVTPEDQYKGVSHHIHYQFRCLICDNNFDDYIDNGHLPKCLSCHPYVPTYTSKQETEVFDYIKTITSSPVLQSNKSIISPYELDIVISNLKIAIEYCGLYWHSEAHKADKNYHLNKMNLCNQKGYRLITIFEDEWTKTPNIVKSRLKNLLGADQRIYARRCLVSTISHQQAREFVNTYHVQGSAIYKIAYGCFYNDELVAVMTFGMPRYDKTAQYELIRYCSRGTVVGGAGKLFAKFVRDYTPKSVISYCDMRWGSGNLYRQLNFVQVEHKQQPSYSYTDFVDRYHRSTFTKKKISRPQDQHKTEYQIMRERNMYRIWDCGQTKWLYTS